MQLLESSMISQKPMPLVALCGMMILGACSTTQPTAAPPSLSSAVKGIPCVSAPVIAYHAPKNATELTELLAGTLPDMKNVYDTPDTISEIRKANAARAAVCGP